MRFHPRVGVLPHEAERPQPLEIDLTVWFARGTAGGRALLDYRELYEIVAAAVAEEPLRYLEDVADAIVGRALGRADVVGARAAVRKPHVALPGPLAYAEVLVERGHRG
jgi:dihydroneopterin aldolase